MKPLCKSIAFFAAVTALSAVAGSARAETPGEKVIRLMDETMTRAKDQSFTYEVITQEPGKAIRTMGMKVQIKGDRWRRIEFLSPGDVKGMKVLVLSLTQMYVYLPAYHKIRRVASNVRSQSFMGTALSQDDMSITRYGETFSGKLLSEDQTSWKVLATRRPGQEFTYGKLEMTILKKEHHPTQIIYYNDQGVKLKSETRVGYSCKEDLCNAKEMTMVDHGQNGLKTTLKLKDWKVNEGLPDALFTPRSIQRSN
jgi:outer membrane lipoprotein-sorting protein